MFTKKTRVISAIATVCMVISMLACIAVPAYAEEVDPTTYPNVQTVTESVTEGDYQVTGIDDWLWFYKNYSKFQDVDVTIHLTGDVDFTGKVNTDTSKYTGATNNCDYNSIYDPAFSLDGHGYSFKNWGSKDAPWKTMGMFRFQNNTGIGMAFIKNVTYDNCHLIGSGNGASIIMRNTGGNAGITSMATNFTMENVHIKKSSLIGEGNLNAMFIGGYATKAGDYTVTMKNCSLIDSTMNAGAAGHSGLLIGKLSSNDNLKVGNITLSNIYVKGNTFNAGRADYDTMLIGNVEGGNVNLTLKNIFATGNTAKYLEANIGIVMNAASGQGGQHHVDMSGIVLQDNTLTTTVTEASRSIVTDTASSTGTFTDVYCNDTAVTSDIQGKGTLTSKIADSYFTSGEAAYALNKNATTDSTFWYTTNTDGVALGTAANATRKVELECNGEIVKTYYANCDTTVAVDYNEVDPTSTYAIKDGSAGSIDAGVVTFGGNNDVTVVVTLGEVAAKAEAKEALAESIKYFTDRNMNYYVAAAATELAEAQAVYAAEGSEKVDYQNAKAELDAYKTQYVGTKENAPSMTEIATYPGAPIYVIRTAADFQAMEDNKSIFDVDDTVYMMNNIDMKGSTYNGVEGFKGSFDGQGYEIQNWGIAADGETMAAINTRGLFHNTYGAAAAIKSIKNVTFVNCHTLSGSCSAMLYGVGHANAGMPADGSATTLDLSNIHFEGCSVTAPAAKHEVAAFLLGRYAIVGADATINITNCSVTGSTFDASATTTDAGHFGLLVGKPRGGNAGEKAVYNFTDCYVGGNTIKYSRTDGGYVGVLFGTAEYQSGTLVNIKNTGIVDNTITIGGNNISLVGHVQTSAVDVNGLIVEGNTVTGGGAVLFRDGNNVTMKNAYCSDTLVAVTTATSSAALTGTTVGDVAAWTANTVSGGNLWWSTTEGAAVKGAATNATRKVTLELGTGEGVGTYYANVGATVAVDYAEEPLAEYSIKEGSSGSIDGKNVTVTENADVIVAVSLGKAQELANAKVALQEAIDYYTVDRKIEYFKDTVTAEIAEAEPMLESDDTAAILAEVTALNALQGELVDEYPNVPSISEMSLYAAVKNYKIMNGDEMVAADTAALIADGITLHLGANIDLTGKSFNGFDGANCDFDGHGFTVANWTCNNTAGMFANYKGGTIKNLTVDNADIGGGYGRAVFAGNGVTGNTTFENVHVKNTVVAENSDGNLGGIFFGQITNDSIGTVRNCSVIDTEIKTNLTDGTAGITNSGIICGRAGKGWTDPNKVQPAKPDTYVVENIYVDGFINNANPATVSKGNGILFGTIEGNLASATVDGAIIVNCGGTAAYEFAGWQYNDKVVTYKNIFAAGNDTLALNGGNSGITNTTVENIFTDTTNLFAAFTSSSDSAHAGMTSEKEGITVMDAAAFKTGEAAYLLNAASGKTLALVDDSFDAYPVMFAEEGYAAPKAVAFVDQSDNNKVVATLYTNASGKLNAAEVGALLENAAYDFKNGEADVTADDVYTADTTVTSNVAHNWEEGTYEQLDNNQHKLTCGDENCTVYKIEDCAHVAYVHRVDGETHVHDSVCACERVLSTGECDLSETPAGDAQHKVACGTCDYEETVDCFFTGYTHDEATVGAESTHTGTCVCGNDETVACSFGDWVETTPADYGVCGVETKTCSVETCGYSYTKTNAMKTNTEVIIETETVDLGVNPGANIYLDIDGLGLAGAKITILTDLEIGAGEFGEAFPFLESSDIEGGIELIIASDVNITGRVLLGSLGFVAPDAAGSFDIEVIVEDAVVISGEGEDATELPAEVAGATAEVVVREAIAGDVNGDSEVTMADAVLVLRVVNGTLNADEISAVGADVDGVAGITTADAVAILQMVMANY